MATVSLPVDFAKTIDPCVVKGKAALVTGGASGIGAGVAKALAEAGAHVTIADLNKTAGEEFVAGMKQEGHEIRFIETDVTDWQSLLLAFKASVDFSPEQALEIVIACAGLTGRSIFREPTFLAPDQASAGDPPPPPPSTAVIDVNFKGAYYTACLALHHFRRPVDSALTQGGRRDNQLIFVSSNIAYNPIPLFSMYAASKMAVRGLWKSLRENAEMTHMRTNLLAPHIVRSPMTAGLQPLMDERGLKMVEVGECVRCLMRMVCDGGITGRAVQVNPEGDWFDLCDDEEGHDGAKAFYEHQTSDTRGQTEFMIELLKQ